MGWIGTTELAAHGIAIEVTAVAFMIHLGLSNAATVRVGWAEGAGDGQGLREGAAMALGLSGVAAFAIIALYLTMAEPIMRLFLNPADPRADEIVAFGSVLIVLAALFQLFDAGQVMLLGLLRGLRDTRVPMVQTAISYWLVGIPASYLLAFPLGLGGAGLWLGLTVGLAVAACLLGLRLWRRLGAIGALGPAAPLPAKG
jgi:MATE family multidrug resistance protein